jgi:hypothetical protein
MSERSLRKAPILMSPAATGQLFSFHSAYQSLFSDQWLTATDVWPVDKVSEAE